MNISRRAHIRAADGRGIDLYVSGPEDGEIRLFHRDTRGALDEPDPVISPNGGCVPRGRSAR